MPMSPLYGLTHFAECLVVVLNVIWSNRRWWWWWHFEHCHGYRCYEDQLLYSWCMCCKRQRRKQSDFHVLEFLVNWPEMTRKKCIFPYINLSHIQIYSFKLWIKWSYLRKEEQLNPMKTNIQCSLEHNVHKKEVGVQFIYKNHNNGFDNSFFFIQFAVKNKGISINQIAVYKNKLLLKLFENKWKKNKILLLISNFAMKTNDWFYNIF